MKKIILPAVLATALAFLPSLAQASWLSEAIHQARGDYNYAPGYYSPGYYAPGNGTPTYYGQSNYYSPPAYNYGPSYYPPAYNTYTPSYPSAYPQYYYSAPVYNYYPYGR